MIKLDIQVLSKAFFWFGLACGVFAIFTQYGVAYQVGTQKVFGDASFYLLTGALSMLAAIYLNTDSSKKLM